MKKTDLKSHWNAAYKTSETHKLGWFEKSCTPSLELIENCLLKKDAAILHVGAGLTLLVDELISLGYTNHIANDISSNALDRLKKRLNSNGSHVKFVENNILNPSNIENIGQVDLWHDRAVLHFFNNKDEQDSYFSLINKLVKPQGYVIIASFSLDGAEKCSGLDVYRYDTKMITEKIGENFEIIKSFDYNYTMPSGDTRAYIYTLYKKK